MVDAVFIHYSESGEVSAATIDGWHKARGFTPRGSNPLRYIGYHYVIHSDGRIEPGRSDDVQGTHCPGWNIPGVIALCLIGSDREPWYPSQSQYEVAAALVRKYDPRAVWLHKEQHPTSCPGRFDKAYLLSLVGQETEEEETMIYSPIKTKDQDGKQVSVFPDAMTNGYRSYLNAYNEDYDSVEVEIYTSLKTPKYLRLIKRYERLSLDLSDIAANFDGFSVIVKTSQPVPCTVTVLKG